MKLSEEIMGDPATRAAIKIQWPVIWRIILKWLPTLIEIILALSAVQLRKRIAAGTLGVPAALELMGITEEEYPESVKMAVKQSSNGAGPDTEGDE